ncbi:MAG: hypothetical protein P1V97_28560 [Planctomycetota bacterium]|nr:hypothetical protein [Planctomycetota bacterium]
MERSNHLIPLPIQNRQVSGATKYGPKRYRSKRQAGSEIAIEAQLLDYARRLTDEQQKQLLERIEALAKDIQSPTAEELGASIEDEKPSQLFNDVEDFVRRLEAGDYFDGWGWDPRIGEERAWGDESWAQEMDEILERISHCFQSGPPAVAGECYSRVLGTFLMGDEAGIFCGPEPAERMLDSDLNLVRARYFRCVYEQTALSKRAQRLFVIMDELDGIGTATIGLQAVMDSKSSRLPDYEDFLPLWIDFLKSREQERSHRPSLFQWERHSQWLLREALQLAKGVDGLAELARERGPGNPEAYHQWIAALIREDNLKKAAFAAREASERIENAEERAAMGEVWAELSVRLSHPRDVLNARRLAFRASPSTRRLLEYCSEGEPAQNTMRQRLKAELEYAETCEKAPSPRLMAVLDLLLGQVELALESLEDSSVIGWSRKDHPGHISFPALLIVGTNSIPKSESVMARLWSQLDTILSLKDEDELPSAAIFRACGLTPPSKTPSSFRALLEPILERLRLSAKRRAELLEGLKRITLRRVQSIVENRFRGAYERASLVTVACAEAFFLAGDEEAGLELLKVTRQDFPRHRAFHKELSELQNDSPLLPNVAA